MKILAATTTTRILFVMAASLACSVAAFSPVNPARRAHNHHRTSRVYDSKTTIKLFSAAAVKESNAPTISSHESPSTTTTATSLDFLNADRSTFEMPKIRNRTLSKTEQEFRDLLGDFAHFSERDIQSVASPRMRTLFEGVKASAGEEAVYRSFEVLFTDFLPIRIAGRLIYKRLTNTMQESQRKRTVQVQTVAQATGLDATEVDMLRISFISTAQEHCDKQGQAFLSKKQLQDSGIGDIVIDEIGYASVDAFFDVLDTNSDGRLSFEELMMGLYSYAEESCFNNPDCNQSQVLHELLAPLLHDERQSDYRVLNAKQQAFSDRYDEMIDAFNKWETDLVDTSGQGRQLDVLRGCFVGAKNEKVLEALRIVYVDYGPLRVAGNLIFKLMSALVKSRQ